MVDAGHERVYERPRLTGRHPLSPLDRDVIRPQVAVQSWNNSQVLASPRQPRARDPVRATYRNVVGELPGCTSALCGHRNSSRGSRLHLAAPGPGSSQLGRHIAGVYTHVFEGPRASYEHASCRQRPLLSCRTGSVRVVWTECARTYYHHQNRVPVILT